MLVEFSPWETTDTSLRLSLSKRKRPRVGLPTSSSSSDGAFSVAGAFITSKAARRKQRTHSDSSSKNVLAITSSHRVSVLVSKNNSKGGTAGGAPKTEALDSSYLLQESGRLQYSCRPSKATSFLPETPTPATKNNKIPAVFDAKNDRFWALQNENKRIVTWDADSEGPDRRGASNRSVCDLKEAALSLNLLPNGVVIGTCESGSIYCASLDTTAIDNEPVHCHYLPRANLPEKSQHAGSFVSFSSLGVKRKPSDHKHHAGPHTVQLYQVFVSGCTATIVRNELVTTESDSDKDAAIMKRRINKVASVSLLPLGMDEASSVLEDATLISSTISNPETATLYFRVRSLLDTSSSDGGTRYCCSVQLSSATTVYPPFSVPCGPQHIAMITPNYLAVGFNGSIQLCDAFTGVILHSEPLPAGLEEEDEEEWMMLADARKGLLVVLYCRGEQLKVAKSLLKNEETLGEPFHQGISIGAPFQMSLAAKLSAALGVSTEQQLVEPSIMSSMKQPRLMTFAPTKKNGVVVVHEGVEYGLKAVREMESSILKRKGNGYKPGSLVDTYRRAVTVILQRSHSTQDGKDTASVKASAAAPSSCKKKANGMNGQKDKDPPEKAKERVNGFHDEPKNGIHCARKGKENGNISESAEKGSDTFSKPSTDQHPWNSEVTRALPLAFIDHVTEIVLRLLVEVASTSEFSSKSALSIKEDCCVVLKRLLASGKVSARKHFDDAGDAEQGQDFLKVLGSIGDEQTKTSRLTSPIDVINGMLKYCSDISESQLVTMLQFFFCRSRPADIAISLLELRLPKNHPYKVLSSRFMDRAKELNSPSPEKKRKKSNKVNGSEDMDKTRNKLVIAGAAVLLERILLYSYCNPTLLGGAIRATFSVGYEPELLVRLLCDVGLSRSKFTGLTLSKRHHSKVELAGSSIHWIQAILDAFPGILSRSEDNDCLDHLRHSLALARQQSQALIGLKGVVEEARKILLSENERSRKRRRIIVDEDAVPAYSVERLTL